LVRLIHKGAERDGQRSWKAGFEVMLRKYINQVLEPVTPREYATVGLIFILLIPLLAGIGAIGITCIAQLAQWATRGPVYVGIIACGITINSGAAIYCLNQSRTGQLPMQKSWKQVVLRRSLNCAIGLVTFLLALCQLTATAVLVLIIGMAIFGIAMPSIHVLLHLLTHR
jgi:hypothetical protein